MEMRSPSTGGSMEDEVPGDDGAMERSAIKLIVEVVQPNDAGGGFEHGNSDGDQRAAGDCAIKHTSPDEDAAADDGPKPEEKEPLEMQSDEDWEKEFHEEMDQVRLYKKLLTGPKVKKSGKIKKVRVEGEAIDRLLQVRPRDMARPKELSLPEDFHLAPADLRAACLRNIEKAREGFEYEQYIIDQYFDKGYAKVHAYVFDE